MANLINYTLYMYQADLELFKYMQFDRHERNCTF